MSFLRRLVAANVRPFFIFFLSLILTSDLFLTSSIRTAQKERHEKNVDAISASVPALFSLFSSKRSPSLIPESGEGESTPESDDDPEARNDWFLFQRTYPSDSLPSHARLQAWESVPKFRTESFTPQATLGWRAIGPSPTIPVYGANWGLTSGRINAVAVSPSNSRIVLAGSATGGIWRSEDSGASFAPVSDDQIDLAVGSIAFSKSNSSIVYAGMGDSKLGYLGSGVLRSTNEGKSWARVSNNSLPSPGTISKIEVDPSDPNRVYAAQYLRLDKEKVTSSGFYVSTDGGVNWNRTQAGAARDVVIDAANSRTLYLGLSRIDKDTDPLFGLYRSTDRGITWTNIFTTQYEPKGARDIRIAVTPANTQRIYVYFGGRAGSQFEASVRVSTDGGATWIDRGASGFDLAQFGYNTFIVVDPQNANTVYLGSRDLYKSTDGAVSWTNLTRNFTDVEFPYSYSPGLSNTHPDQHAMAFSPNNSNQFYIGNDGGISKTNDGGSTFQSLNSTFTLTQFTNITLHPTNPAITYGGTQDNGTQRRFSESGPWYEIISGDGGRTVLDPQNPSTVFTTFVRGAIFRFFDDGRFFENQVAWNSSFGEPDDGARIGFYPPFTGNGIDSTLYFGTWRLFTSNNWGDSWSATAGFLDLTKGVTTKGPDVLSAVSVARSDKNVIYTGSSQGRAMVSKDGGVTWTDVSRGLPDRFITAITIDATNSANAYLTVSGFLSGHVFKTTDAGASWIDITGSLPDIPTNALLIDAINPKTLYLGTDIGVFRSTDGGATWRDFNKGMPPVIVSGFAAQQSGLIQAATYGRGAFELVGNERPSIASATFDGKKKLDVGGRALDNAARVLINDKDQTDRISSISETVIKLKGKMKKLGLKEGDNTIQVINSNESPSNIFVLKIGN